jgi:hypothetical protein
VTMVIMKILIMMMGMLVVVKLTVPLHDALLWFALHECSLESHPHTLC